MLPNFSLLKDAGSGRFRLRPSGEEENISNPFHSESRSGWVLEYVADKMPGMVVRRNWISSDVPAGVGFDTGVHVEQYLVRQSFSTRLARRLMNQCSSSDTPNRFPYTAEFSHSPSTKQTGGLEQRWSVVHPGPAGYLFGRVGWSEDDETAVKLIMVGYKQKTYLVLAESNRHCAVKQLSMACCPVSLIQASSDSTTSLPGQMTWTRTTMSISTCSPMVCPFLH